MLIVQMTQFYLAFVMNYFWKSKFSHWLKYFLTLYYNFLNYLCITCIYFMDCLCITYNATLCDKVCHWLAICRWFCRVLQFPTHTQNWPPRCD